MAETNDAVVIGAGPAGYTCAIRLAQLGQRVVVVERADVGGVCLNWGCIPSKALIDAAHFQRKLQDAPAMGFAKQTPGVDVSQLQRWKDSIVAKLTKGVRALLKESGATLIEGQARVIGPTAVEVKGEDGSTVRLEARTIVIATGSSTAQLEALPFDGTSIVGARDALSLPAIPRRLLVIGGGVIGLEIGSMYQAFGAELTVVEASDALLNGVDPDCAAVVERALKRKGAVVHKATRVLGCQKTPAGVAVTLTSVGAEGSAVVEADVVLVAVGMRPSSAGLGLEEVGVRIDARGFIVTDGAARTDVPSIFAIGDVSGAPLLAHKAFKEARVAAEVIAGQSAQKDWIGMPAAIFTDPEIAHVGMSEAEAKRLGRSIKVGRMPFAVSGRALAMRETEGFVKTITDRETHQVLGVHIVGPRASDMISECALALEFGATAEDIAMTVHPHPTLGEAVMISSEHALGSATDILNR